MMNYLMNQHTLPEVTVGSIWKRRLSSEKSCIYLFLLLPVVSKIRFLPFWRLQTRYNQRIGKFQKQVVRIGNPGR